MMRRNKIRLLIIDEHAAVRRALARRLGAAPTLDIVGTSARAEELEAIHADVVLLGVRSHNRSLKQTMQSVRALAQEGTAVIVLAPYANDVEQEQFLLAGARRYLLKDINTRQLVAEIEAVGAKE